MRVQVSDKYKGVFGAVDDELGIVRAKKAGDPPFEVPDYVGIEKIRAGVLVRVDAAPIAEEPVFIDTPMDAPVLEAEAVQDSPVLEAEKPKPKRRKTTKK